MAVLVFGLGGLVYFVGNEDAETKELSARKVESINWEKDYNSESKHPYGTYFIREILQEGLQNHSVKDIDVSVEEYFDSTDLQLEAEEVTYMFVGKSLNLFPSEVQDLLDFVDAGNNVFIAAEFLPARLLDNLFVNYNSADYFDYTSDTSIVLSFNNENFPNEYNLINWEKDKPKTRRWRYVNYGVSYTNGSVRGKAKYRPCFIEFEYGGGKILLHTVPQAFTNKHLSSNQGREYVEIVLSYFPNSAILFDNYTTGVYENELMEIDHSNSNRSTGRWLSSDSSFNFLLSNMQLRWAYLLIIFAVVLFIIFRGKREQKIIPTTQSNDNSSLEFTETIARLYLKQNQHNKLIVHMEKIFKNKMRAKYYVAYNDDTSYAKRLAQKSGVEEEEIKALLKHFKGGKNITAVSDEYLINLYKKLNDFYKKAK